MRCLFFPLSVLPQPSGSRWALPPHCGTGAISFHAQLIQPFCVLAQKPGSCKALIPGSNTEPDFYFEPLAPRQQPSRPDWGWKQKLLTGWIFSSCLRQKSSVYTWVNKCPDCVLQYQAVRHTNSSLQLSIVVHPALLFMRFVDPAGLLTLTLGHKHQRHLPGLCSSQEEQPPFSCYQVLYFPAG